MKKKEVIMNKNSENMETKNEANQVLASENNQKGNNGEYKLPKVTFDDKFVEEIEMERALEKEAHLERFKNANALYGNRQKGYDDIQKEFEKLKQKSVEEIPPIDENLDEAFEVISASSLLNDEIEQIPMLVHPLFHSVGLALLVGSSDIGKSTFLKQFCVSVVTGIKFLGMEVNAKHKIAIYVSSEDDQMSTSFVLKKQNKEYNLSAKEVDGLKFIFETDLLLERLECELEKQRADVIVIDALTDLINTDLYKANDVRFFLNQYSQLAKKYQCLIIFLHHTRKNSENVAPSKNNSLGSQAIEAKSRLVLEIKANLNNPTIRHLCPVKGNYLPHELKRSSIDMMFTDNLTFQSLGTNTPFDKINTNEVNFTKLETEYNEIISLKEQGLNYREIAMKFGVSHTTIQRKIKSYEKLKNTQHIIMDKN